MGNTSVIPSGKPIYLKSDSDRAVLCLHGFTGYTNDLRYLAGQLNNEGYTVFAPRLPGHATNHRDFLSSNARDWYSCSRNAYLDLSASYSDVTVLGFSMGGVLSIILAEEFHINRLILIAPAITVRRRGISLSKYLWPFIPSLPGSPVYNGNSSEQEYMYNEYWKINRPKCIAQLYKLQKRGMAALSGLTADTLVVVSEKDQTVSPEVADIIETRGRCSSFSKILLKNSPHVSFDETAPERDLVTETVTGWLR